jgi:hypothetical protein
VAILGQARQLRLEPGEIQARLPKLRFGFIGPPHIGFEERRGVEQVRRVGPVRHEVCKSAQKSQDDFQIGGLWQGVHGQPERVDGASLADSLAIAHPNHRATPLRL